MSRFNNNNSPQSGTPCQRLSIIFFLFTFIFFLTAYSLPLNATIRYVNPNGNNIPPYITFENGAWKIQDCIDVSFFGDTIFVSNGVYQEQVVMIDGLALIGAGMDSCIVDSRNYPLTNNRTITMQNSCLVTGFYIRSSNNFSYGYGIWAIGQAGIITKNKFSNANVGIVLYASNITTYKNYCFNLRQGINVFNSNSIVRKNDIFTLTETIGSGIFIQADNSSYKPIIDSNYIETKSEGIRKSIGASPIIKNNTIILKTAPIGIFLSTSDSSYISNNIIIAESGAEGIDNSGVQYLQLINNYVMGNVGDAIIINSNDIARNNVITGTNKGIVALGTLNLIVQYNNFWNNNNNGVGFTPDTTNLSVDPMVINDDSTQGELDFHLQAYSPLINAGDPTILDNDSSRSDIGLYGGPYGESYYYVDLLPRSPVNLTVIVDSLIELNWNKNTEADLNHYNLYRDTTNNFQIDSTKLIASITDTFYNVIIPTGVESLYFKITAVDNQDNESNPSEEVGVLITSVEDKWKLLNNYILYQNYPNPFNPSTTISYKLKERGYVKLYVYDIKGELVSVLVNEIQEAGYYEVEFNSTISYSGDARNLASGVYIYQIFVKGENNIPMFSDIKKMVYVK